MPATGPKNITTAALKRALRKHAGVFVLAAQELGCDRTNVAHRVGRSPELQAFVASIDEEIGDIAEAVIKGALLEKQPGTNTPTKEAKTMARWYGNMKLGSRGYRTRSEITGKDGAPLPIGPAAVHVHVEYIDAPKPAADTEGDVI